MAVQRGRRGWRRSSEALGQPLVPLFVAVRVESVATQAEVLIPLAAEMTRTTLLFPIDAHLAPVSRVAGWMTGTREGVRDVAVLAAMGAMSAAAVTLLDFGLGVPGHAIVRGVLPVALGLALVPRRRAGFVMGTGAVSFLAVLPLLGVALPGLGAMASLCAIGPLLELALGQGRERRHVYVALALAGLVANEVAFVARVAPTLLGFGGGPRNMARWWPLAVFTYPASGIVAGLLGAVVLFRPSLKRDASRG